MSEFVFKITLENDNYCDGCPLIYWDTFMLTKMCPIINQNLQYCRQTKTYIRLSNCPLIPTPRTSS